MVSSSVPINTLVVPELQFIMSIGSAWAPGMKMAKPQNTTAATTHNLLTEFMVHLLWEFAKRLAHSGERDIKVTRPSWKYLLIQGTERPQGETKIPLEPSHW